VTRPPLFTATSFIPSTSLTPHPPPTPHPHPPPGGVPLQQVQRAITAGRRLQHPGVEGAGAGGGAVSAPGADHQRAQGEGPPCWKDLLESANVWRASCGCVCLMSTIYPMSLTNQPTNHPTDRPTNQPTDPPTHPPPPGRHHHRRLPHHRQPDLRRRDLRHAAAAARRRAAGAKAGVTKGDRQRDRYGGVGPGDRPPPAGEVQRGQHGGCVWWRGLSGSKSGGRKCTGGKSE
jgi:hypothetical protein